MEKKKKSIPKLLTKNSKIIAKLSSSENSSMPFVHKHYMQKSKAPTVQ